LGSFAELDDSTVSYLIKLAPRQPQPAVLSFVIRPLSSASRLPTFLQPLLIWSGPTKALANGYEDSYNYRNTLEGGIFLCKNNFP
jgi:hypothetical protein